MAYKRMQRFRLALPALLLNLLAYAAVPAAKAESPERPCAAGQVGFSGPRPANGRAAGARSQLRRSPANPQTADDRRQSQPTAHFARQPAESDRVLPINLATALCLSNARPLVIAFAQASVEEAAAQLQHSKVLWLPDFNFGAGYTQHDGTDQSTDGTMITDDKSALGTGGGATFNFGITDAIFRPLADRQVLAARQADLQTVQNDVLLTVASSYFDVQQARGSLAGAMDAIAKANMLCRKTRTLAEDLVAPIEVDRARALLFDLEQQAAVARANWRIATLA